MSRLVRVDLIDASPFAEHYADAWADDEQDFEAFVADIERRGVQNPLHVHPVGGRFELLTGHRRLRAAKRLGLAEVPVEFRLLADDEAREEYFVKDNSLHRPTRPAALARAAVLRHPDFTLERIAEFAGVAVTTAHRARTELSEQRPDIFQKEITDSIGRTRPRTYTPRDPKPRPESKVVPISRAEQMREQREAQAPAATAAFDIEEEADTAEPTEAPEVPPHLQAGIAERLHAVRASAWNRLSTYIVGIPIMPDLTDEGITEAVNDPDYDDYVYARAVDRNVAFLLRVQAAQRAKKEARSA